MVGAEAAESERLRTMSAPIVDALWSSGLMTAFNPREAGGLEPGFAEMIDTWIEMAWQDGSFGWIGIANFPSTFAAACYLPDAGFAEVFTDNDNRVTMGGQFAPLGQGVEVDGGYRLSGSWSFGSGTGHSQYVAAGFMPMRDGMPQMMDNGMPVMMVALLPREQVTFTDGWHVQGLKGTGSYDYTVADVFVPAHRTFELFTRDPLRGGSPVARMGLMAVTAAGHAAWALGVAKSMLDDVQELAATKYRMSDMASLASRPTFQKDLAHHVCAWRAARLLLLDVFGDAETAAGGDGLTPPIGPTCELQRCTPPTSRGSVRSGRICRPAPPRSGRVPVSSGPSGTSTPAPSTPSSARRWRWTPRRCGWDWSRTSSPSDGVG